MGEQPWRQPAVPGHREKETSYSNSNASQFPGGYGSRIGASTYHPPFREDAPRSYMSEERIRFHGAYADDISRGGLNQAVPSRYQPAEYTSSTNRYPLPQRPPQQYYREPLPSSQRNWHAPVEQQQPQNTNSHYYAEDRRRVAEQAPRDRLSHYPTFSDSSQPSDGRYYPSHGREERPQQSPSHHSPVRRRADLYEEPYYGDTFTQNRRQQITPPKSSYPAYSGEDRYRHTWNSEPTSFTTSMRHQSFPATSRPHPEAIPPKPAKSIVELQMEKQEKLQRRDSALAAIRQTISRQQPEIKENTPTESMPKPNAVIQPGDNRNEDGTTPSVQPASTIRPDNAETQQLYQNIDQTQRLAQLIDESSLNSTLDDNIIAENRDRSAIYIEPYSIQPFTEWKDETAPISECILKIAAQRRRSLTEKQLALAAVYKEKKITWEKYASLLESEAFKEPLATASTPGLERGRRGQGLFINSEADFESILAQSARDPAVLAQPNFAVIPDMILDPDTPMFIDENSKIDTERVEQVLLKIERPWTAEEHDLFLASFATHGKRFGLIAAEIPNRSAKDCVWHYYSAKKARSGSQRFDWKDLLGVKNKDKTRKSSRKRRPGFGKKLLDDLMAHTENVPISRTRGRRVAYATSASGTADEDGEDDQNKKRGAGRPKKEDRFKKALAFKKRNDEDSSNAESSRNATPPAIDKSSSRRPPSSYWTVMEVYIFQKHFPLVGHDWRALADIIKTKSRTQVRNYYIKHVSERSRAETPFDDSEDRQMDSDTEQRQGHHSGIHKLLNNPETTTHSSSDWFPEHQPREPVSQMWYPHPPSRTLSAPTPNDSSTAPRGFSIRDMLSS